MLDWPMARLCGFPPLGWGDSSALILGSFPSLASLEARQYYGHARNQFWSIVAASLGRSTPPDYAGRVDLLSEAGLALWDVIESCERQGSLDAAITAESANDLPAFLLGHPGLVAIGLNGGKAADSFRACFRGELDPGALAIGVEVEWQPPFLGGRKLALVRLPSTSPIPTPGFRKAEDKVPAWSGFIRSAVPPLPRGHPNGYLDGSSQN
jgi:hypoxanthine-DNA glycosylase